MNDGNVFLGVRGAARGKRAEREEEWEGRGCERREKDGQLGTR